MSLQKNKVLIFDCYGTLIDWETGMWESLKPLTTQSNAPSRSALFEKVHEHESRIQKESPKKLYPDVLAETYRAVAEDLHLEADETAAQTFGESVGDWPAFEDTANALKVLHGHGLKMVVLSNVDNASFERSRKKLEGEGGTFDAVYTAENIGSYKPDLRNFEYATSLIKKEFGFDKDEMLIVANSKFHDVQPGRQMGLKSAWIVRGKAVMGVSSYGEVQPDWTFPDMISFAKEISKSG